MSTFWLKLRQAIQAGDELLPLSQVRDSPLIGVEAQRDQIVATVEPVKEAVVASPSQVLDIQDTVERASQDARRYILQVGPFLNLLGKTEGTDKGRGYNETLGYGAYTGGPVNLVNMLLSTVDALQTKMLAHPKNSMNSSAVGRYQVVRTTLRTLKKKWSITDSQFYDERLQDDLAYILLVGRGLVRWRKGELTDLDFVDALSKEWASLPNRHGVGSYGGQHAGCTLADLLKVLASIK